MDRSPAYPDTPALFRVPEAARYLNIGRAAAYGMAQRGELPVIRFGRSVRIPKAALDDYLASQVQAPTSPPLGRTGR